MYLFYSILSLLLIQDHNKYDYDGNLYVVKPKDFNKSIYVDINKKLRYDVLLDDKKHPYDYYHKLLSKRISNFLNTKEVIDNDIDAIISVVLEADGSLTNLRFLSIEGNGSRFYFKKIHELQSLKFPRTESDPVAKELIISFGLSCNCIKTESVKRKNPE